MNLSVPVTDKDAYPPWRDCGRSRTDGFWATSASQLAIVHFPSQWPLPPTLPPFGSRVLDPKSGDSFIVIWEEPERLPLGRLLPVRLHALKVGKLSFDRT